MSFSAVLFSLFISCEQASDEVVSVQLKTPVAKRNLFTNSYIRDLSFEEPSFPNWFNKKVVIDNAISQITIHKVNPNNVIDGLDSLLIEESHLFYFSDSGWVKSFTHIGYHDAVLLSEETFNYASPPDTNGFCQSTVIWSKKTQKYKTVSSLVGVLEVLNTYNKYSKQYEDTSILLFKNELHPQNELETYILDSSKWNVVAVDQLIKTYDSKHIHYGSPLRPVASYKLENVVEKTDWTTYSYINHSPFLNAVFIQNKFTFTDKTLYYDSLGRLDYMQSATLAMDSSIIEMERHTFQYNAEHLPVKLIYSKGYDEASLVGKHEWVISYIFRED